ERSAAAVLPYLRWGDIPGRRGLCHRRLYNTCQSRLPCQLCKPRVYDNRRSTGGGVMTVQVLAKTLEMPRDEWLELRRKGIGGSDAAAIVGLDRYRSAFDVYADKLGLKTEMPD